MISTIIFLLLFLDSNPNSGTTNFHHQTILNPVEIQGTWKTTSPRKLFEPVYTIIIDKREIFIYMFDQGAGGYKQLLTYKLEGDNIVAKEKEIIFFDQHVGNITAHYKHRSYQIQLIWDNSVSPSTLVLEPMQPGSVLTKDSDKTDINFHAKDEFSRLKKCPYFKSDY